MKFGAQLFVLALYTVVIIARKPNETNRPKNGVKEDMIDTVEEQSNKEGRKLNILIFHMFLTPSHKTASIHLSKALHKRGHNVTLFSMNKNNKATEGVREVVIAEFEKAIDIYVYVKKL